MVIKQVDEKCLPIDESRPDEFRFFYECVYLNPSLASLMREHSLLSPRLSGSNAMPSADFIGESRQLSTHNFMLHLPGPVLQASQKNSENHSTNKDK